MSNVTNAILTAACDEDLALGALKPFVRVEDAADGHCEKRIECIIAVAAFNYLDVDELIERIVSAPWHNPEQVMLLLRRQDDYMFFPFVMEGRRCSSSW